MHKRMSATKAILISFMCSLLKISLEIEDTLRFHPSTLNMINLSDVSIG